MRCRRHHRRAAVAVETAVVQSVMFILLLALVAGGLGVFRYQEVTSLAREAVRAASVKGGDYAAQSGQSSPTQQQILTTVVQPRAVGMDLTKLSITVQWINGSTGEVVAWDSSTRTVKTTDASTGSPVTNRVRVTVTYQWSPEFFGAGPYWFQSVSEGPMSF
jgi:Flp pilus assembly protein TadG